MYMYKLYEFRQNLREAFNIAEHGENVVIERYGKLFELKLWKDSNRIGERHIVERQSESSTENDSDEEEWVPPDTYFIDRATGHVVDTSIQDYIDEEDEETIAWLKSHNRYVG